MINALELTFEFMLNILSDWSLKSNIGIWLECVAYLNIFKPYNFIY